MALLQNTTSNILFADNNGEAEAATIMESPKKIVEDHEEKDDVKKDMDVLVTEELSGGKNVQIKESTTTESDASGVSPSKPSDLVADVVPQEVPENEKNEPASDVEAEEEEQGEQGDVEKEKRKGLFDMPLEVEGKRERHKVDRITIATPTVKKHSSSIQMGDGIPLGEIAYIEDQLKKHSPDELKTMHRVLFGYPGKATTVKKEIRKFTGFAFKEDSQEFKKKVALLQKLSVDQLKTIKNVLGLHSGGQSKEAVVTTIMVFLMKTVDHGRRVPKKRKSSAPKTPSTTKRSKKSKDEIDPTDDDEDEDDGDKKKSTSKTPESGFIAKKPKKARKTGSQKEITSKQDSRSDNSDNKKKKSTKESKDSDADTSSSSSVETQQETKPSEKELENVIEELLSQVDLSQVSMKQMCQAVIEKFPGTNIGNRVDYLKGLIKQSLATK